MSFEHSITYVPGTATALVGDGLAVLLAADPVGPLVAACRSALDGGRGVDGVLGALSAGPPADFALVSTEGGGVRVVVAGRGQVDFAGGLSTSIAAAGVPHWIDQRLDAAPDLRLLLADLNRAADPSWPVLPIGSGTVLADALFAPAVASGAGGVDPDATTGQVPAEPTPAEPTPAEPAVGEPTPVEPPSPPEPPTVVAPLLSAFSQPWPAPAPDPGPAAPPGPPPSYVGAFRPPAGDGAPMVQAVMCANSHLNAPFVVGACRVCGAPVPAQAPFVAPRPSLGVLVLDSGEAVPVDRDVLLGRAPFSVDDDGPRVITLPSPNNDLSRTHVRVGIDGWLVQVSDLGSTNGTVVTMPGQQGVRLRAHEPFVLVPGTVINLADEAHVRFEVPG